MKIMHWRAVAIGGTALALALAGCGGSSSKSSTSSSGSSTTSGGAKPIDVALVLPCPTNDMSWCQQANEAATQLQSEGQITLKTTSNAPQDTASVSQLLSQYAQRGAKLVIAHSAWQDAALAVGPKFPNASFAFAGGGTIKDNVSTYGEPIYQPAYLAGILAGGMTKTGVIGGLAGQDVPLCHAELQAFLLGAKRTRPDVKQLNTYIGDWNDPAKAKEATNAQADQKADVFVACGGGPSQGMVGAIRARNLSGFAYVGDQASLAPKNVAGSLVYNLYPYFKAMVADVRAGKFSPAHEYNLGLKEGGFELKLNPAFSAVPIPASATKEMEKVQAQVKAGTFTIPYVIK